MKGEGLIIKELKLNKSIIYEIKATGLEIFGKIKQYILLKNELSLSINKL